MTKLSDTQRILLSTASAPDDGSILPLPGTVAPGGSAAKAIAALLKRGLAEEREVSDPAATCRIDSDLRYGVFITAARAVAIGVEPPKTPPASDAVEASAVAPQSAASATKVDRRWQQCWRCCRDPKALPGPNSSRSPAGCRTRHARRSPASVGRATMLREANGWREAIVRHSKLRPQPTPRDPPRFFLSH